MKLVCRSVTEMIAMTKPFVFAWHFLTAIPLSRSHHEPTAAELATSMAWYSTVGLMIGGLLALADGGLRYFLAAEVVNVLLIVLLVLLTRGLHQDGLADTLDGLAGGQLPAWRHRTRFISQLARIRPGRCGSPARRATRLQHALDEFRRPTRQSVRHRSERCLRVEDAESGICV